VDTMTREGASPAQIRDAIVQGAYKSVPIE
jgi:hypothetical protein